MALDLTIQRSRRALLAAAAGAASAFVAQALGRPLPARAADGQAVLVGGEYTSTSATIITNSTNDDLVLYGWNKQGGHGVRGNSGSGFGLYGTSGTGTGVFGTSVSSVAIHGVSGSVGEPTLIAHSVSSSTAVLAFSASTGDLLPAAPVKTAVYGYAVQDAASRGVWGRSNTGYGTFGEVTSGDGVHGKALSGRGGSFEATTGIALHAKGRVQLEQASGTGTILASASNKTITPGFDLTTTSKVLVTLLGHPGGSVTLRHVGIDATANTFTVYLTAAATNNTKFAWLVLV
jgi:hypothetical protein